MKIYVLIDPRDEAVRYLGVTTQTLENRLSGHAHERKLRTRKGLWVEGLYRLNLRPLIRQIGTTNEGWQETERRLIAEYRAAGHDLLNMSIGGKGRASPHSAETRRKISAAKRGRPSAWRDRATRNARISAAKKGRPITPRVVQDTVLSLFAEGRSKRSISKQVGICRETIRNIIRVNQPTVTQ